MDRAAPLRLVALLAVAGHCAGACAQDDAAALPKQLSNPIASLTSVPMQLNFDGATHVAAFLPRPIPRANP